MLMLKMPERRYAPVVRDWLVSIILFYSTARPPKYTLTLTVRELFRKTSADENLTRTESPGNPNVGVYFLRNFSRLFCNFMNIIRAEIKSQGNMFALMNK